MDLAKTAGIIIIGDEMLTGNIKHVNTHFLIRELWSRVIMVRRISTIHIAPAYFRTKLILFRR